MCAKTVIIIAGPTAVGKTRLAIALASYFNTAIISADSRQCFRELNIGVAKPTPNELQSVIHYFINSHSITQNITAATFEEFALRALDDIFESHDTAIVAGGTGLYIRALVKGFDYIPAVPEIIREEVKAVFQQQGREGLAAALLTEDPDFAKEGEMKNPQRMMRALEVIRSSGISIRAFQQAAENKRSFNTISIGLELPREQLYERINQRVDIMMEDGLLEEVKSLKEYRDLNALQTVGYREMFEFLDGEKTLKEAVDKIKQNTRHYAKRQLTWFKADPEIRWFNPADEEQIIAYLSVRANR
jgi:tRNA dimethylallyltransferase